MLMKYLTHTAQVAGTLIAVFVAMLALFQTISSDRTARLCVSLYEKNDKLIAMYAEAQKVQESLSKMEETVQAFAKAMKARMEEADGEISNKLEQDIDKHLELALRTQGQTAISLQSLFRQYRYVYSKEEFSEILSGLNQEFGDQPMDNDEARVKAVTSHYERYQDSIRFALKTIDARAEKIADELRNSCEI